MLSHILGRSYLATGVPAEAHNFYDLAITSYPSNCLSGTSTPFRSYLKLMVGSRLLRRCECVIE